MRSITLLLLLVAQLPVLHAQVPSQNRPEPTEGSRLAVPGGRIWYRVTGGGSGIPLILLHGGPGNPSVYLKSLEALGNERIVVRYDQLGAGYSDVVHDTSVFNIPHYMNGTSPFEPTGTLRQYDATPLLKAIKVPVLFIAGDVDVAGPDNIRRHASITPNSRLVIIPNAGHHTQWDNLSATLAAARSFLRDVESRR